MTVLIVILLIYENKFNIENKLIKCFKFPKLEIDIFPIMGDAHVMVCEEIFRFWGLQWKPSSGTNYTHQL